MFPYRFMVLHTLLEATVTLYPADPAGAPVLSRPIWMGVDAENVVIRERWLKAETRPTGARYPKRRPLVAQYEVNLGRVWAHELPKAGGGLQFGSGQHVLEVVWTDEESGDWHREIYYGVTISERSRASRDVDNGFTDEQTFEAETMVADGGPGATPVPPISPELPYYVRYIGDGGVNIYQYDPATKLFTETTAGVSVGRALVGVDAGGSFLVQFYQDASTLYTLPSLEVTTAGEVIATAFREGAPTGAYLPRVDFMYGSLRVASVGVPWDRTEGVLWSAAFTEGAPAAGAGKFAIVAGDQVRLTLGATGAVAAQFVEGT